MRIQESDNKKLYHHVESHLKNNCSTIFWGKMHELIPDKTALQLRQYFHNSFARFMHQQYLS
ncbi:SANT/Myb_domain [Hexamita inflata]|uniref:SANT/Myb_domain n=2 Tax=Hexamita inflata TaxID=28002 RepID=A0ABP1KJ77_9EUKA